MRERLLDRFLKYVQIYTPSSEESDTSPSTKWQFDLAHALEAEMTELGISGVYVDENCYVYGYIPASKGCEGEPAIGFISHMDTVSDFCDRPTVPVVHEDHDGGDIFLEAGDRTIRVKDFPLLEQMKGRTIITSDGTTILGADDKAGIAEIMTMAEELMKGDIPHGRICIAFTPDEEIGSGASLLDLERFGADFAYTVDGGPEGGIEYETFNAAAARISVTGVNVHPGSAKDIMVNAAAVACEFQAALPEAEQPRNTSGYEGFYHLTSISGGVSGTLMNYIIRDHDREKFEERKQRVSEIAQWLNDKYGEGTVEVQLSDTYYNMAEIMKDHMEVVDRAKEAIRAEGLEPEVEPVRGGTDGASLSFRGLPCPNLATGGIGCHGPFEHVSLEGMEICTRVLINIAGC